MKKKILTKQRSNKDQTGDVQSSLQKKIVSKLRLQQNLNKQQHQLLLQALIQQHQNQSVSGMESNMNLVKI